MAIANHSVDVRFAVARVSLVIALVSIAVACSSDSALGPFSSDGCSLFLDSSLINEDDWCRRCFEHDLAYWRGGTYEERELADSRLKDCVLKNTKNAALATLMYEGVRFGGSPYFYNWYRWGHGWDYDRKYQGLTPQEKEVADTLVDEYFASVKGTVCDI